MSLEDAKTRLETKKGSDGAGATPSSGPRPWYETFLELSEKIGKELDNPLDVDPVVVDPRLRGGNSEIRDGVTYASDEEHARRLRDTQMHVLSSQHLLSEIRPDFEKLSFHIFPRIFELDEQEELISSLIEVEAAFQAWESNVDTIEGDWGMPDEFAWDAAAQFCGRIGEMLKIIYLTESASEHQNQVELISLWSRGLRRILPRKFKVKGLHWRPGRPEHNSQSPDPVRPSHEDRTRLTWSSASISHICPLPHGELPVSTEISLAYSPVCLIGAGSWRVNVGSKFGEPLACGGPEGRPRPGGRKQDNESLSKTSPCSTGLRAG